MSRISTTTAAKSSLNDTSLLDIWCHIHFVNFIISKNSLENSDTLKLVRKTVSVLANPFYICPTIFMDSLEEDTLSNSLLKPLVWWRYIGNIFMVWEHGEEELKKFLETLIAIILL